MGNSIIMKLSEENNMKQLQQFTAVIEREGDGYVALCPELDIASQGNTVEEAKRNLVEAIELYLDTADPSEIQSRLHTEVFVTRVEVAVG
jgi:predicted RNase H-like HicB family nuclease